MADEANSLYYRGAALTDILRVGGMNADLSTDMSDPRNAAYLKSISDKNERMVMLMAGISYSAVRDKRGEDKSFDPDAAFRQCRVDARRILIDPHYARLFNCTFDPRFVPHLIAEMQHWLRSAGTIACERASGRGRIVMSRTRPRTSRNCPATCRKPHVA